MTIEAKLLLKRAHFRLLDYKERLTAIELEVERVGLFDGTVGHAISRREDTLPF